VFPGLFRGAIDIRAKKVTLGMKMAAAVGIAGLLKEEDLSPDMIIAGALDTAVSILVARKVAEAGIEENMAQRVVDSDLVAENLKYFHIHGRFNYEKSLTHCSINNMKSNL
jgi:malate dehydrogenase (oxaloacetate-decarboxylating)